MDTYQPSSASFGSRFITLVILIFPLFAYAGMVETVAGKFSGEISFQSDSIKVADRQIDLADVLYLKTDGVPKGLSSLSAVRMINGEVIFGDIVTGSSKQLNIRCKWFGLKPFELPRVSALEFLHNDLLPTGKPKTLYRKEGQPIPGALVWVDKDSIGIESPLGTIKIPRQGLVRYVCDNKPPLPQFPDVNDFDEIGLKDGNVFRGSLRLDNGMVHLEHLLGGSMAFPANMVQFIVRHRPTMIELSNLQHEVISEAKGILGKGNQSAVSNASIPGFIRSTRIEPQVKIRYTQPDRSGKKMLCRATLSPLRMARGMTRFTIAVGNQVLLEKNLLPLDDPHPFEVQVPEGEELVIGVDFGPLVRFPCGVIMQDAHLVVIN
jgi:hypothetical protein